MKSFHYNFLNVVKTQKYSYQDIITAYIDQVTELQTITMF